MAKRNKFGQMLKNKIKLSLFSDSQGRGVQRYIEEVSNGEIDAIEFVYPNAPLVQVANSSPNSSDEVIFLLGGTQLRKPLSV